MHIGILTDLFHIQFCFGLVSFPKPLSVHQHLFLGALILSISESKLHH